MSAKQERAQALERQIARVQRKIEQLEPISNRYSWLRVLAFFGGLGISLLLAILLHWLVGLISALIAMVIFTILAIYHGRIERGLARYRLWSYIKAAHLARLQLDWEHIPEAYIDGPRPGHPFEYDLDITGQRSIHRLLNTAISREGSLRLRDWLLQTKPQQETITRRQELVRELLPLTRFRDKLILNGLLAARPNSEELDGKRLLVWLNRQPSSSALLPLLWIACAFNVATILLLILLFLHVSGLLAFNVETIFGIVFLASIVFFFATGNLRGDIFEDAGYLRYAFATLSRIFSFLEHYPYGQNEELKALCQPFHQDRASGPTALLTRTARIAAASTLRRNPFFWLPVNLVLPWDTYCAYQLNLYKKQIAEQLPVWMDTWYELEALCSLAAFGYLNPAYALPTITLDEPALFKGEALGHPLIPEEQKVTNDFTLSQIGTVILITGSNMAGKSTFLRTLGINLSLAYAGGPVSAASLQLSLFRLFTCIRVTDSVTDGYSYFYAEVRRLRALLEALREPDQPPLFFLIDEIFKGTNNRERLIGSRSYIRALVGQRCVGAITTHDLELVKLAEQVPQLKNYHFREEVVEGQLVFDYRLRTGPCPTTNALKIMEMEGLPIEEAPVL